MNEAAYREILRRLGVEPAAPPADPELVSRAAIFRDQLAGWTGPRVPLLVLPDASEPRVGFCVSCGAETPEGWRCGLCLRAVELALGVA